MNRDTSDPAFPHPDCGHGRAVYPGMTLRDYFAAKVMQGMCSVTGIDFGTHAEAAEIAYAMADAMLKERNK